eukprot:TRINITY_DN5323_c0_g2_i1.p1 TRINITY_DN5323_c0_g2~~TRINITY_DN5323_c0_g2_i1.p1  ORF type:complete len:593 (+),score=67.77 TRINITY_DN5323_c0_g2_i1:1165-2943(+)
MERQVLLLMFCVLSATAIFFSAESEIIHITRGECVATCQLVFAFSKEYVVYGWTSYSPNVYSIDQTGTTRSIFFPKSPTGIFKYYFDEIDNTWGWLVSSSPIAYFGVNSFDGQELYESSTTYDYKRDVQRSPTSYVFWIGNNFAIVPVTRTEVGSSFLVQGTYSNEFLYDITPDNNKIYYWRSENSGGYSLNVVDMVEGSVTIQGPNTEYCRQVSKDSYWDLAQNYKLIKGSSEYLVSTGGFNSSYPLSFYRLNPVNSAVGTILTVEGTSAEVHDIAIHEESQSYALLYQDGSIIHFVVENYGLGYRYSEYSEYFDKTTLTRAEHAYLIKPPKYTGVESEWSFYYQSVDGYVYFKKYTLQNGLPTFKSISVYGTIIFVDSFKLDESRVLLVKVFTPTNYVQIYRIDINDWDAAYLIASHNSGITRSNGQFAPSMFDVNLEVGAIKDNGNSIAYAIFDDSQTMTVYCMGYKGSSCFSGSTIASDTLGIIIGVSVGSVFLLIVGICLIRRSKQRKIEQSISLQSIPPQNTTPAPPVNTYVPPQSQENNNNNCTNNYNYNNHEERVEYTTPPTYYNPEQHMMAQEANFAPPPQFQ